MVQVKVLNKGNNCMKARKIVERKSNVSMPQFPIVLFPLLFYSTQLHALLRQRYMNFILYDWNKSIIYTCTFLSIWKLSHIDFEPWGEWKKTKTTLHVPFALFCCFFTFTLMYLYVQSRAVYYTKHDLMFYAVYICNQDAHRRSRHFQKKIMFWMTCKESGNFLSHLTKKLEAAVK